MVPIFSAHFRHLLHDRAETNKLLEISSNIGLAKLYPSIKIAMTFKDLEGRDGAFLYEYELCLND